MKRSEKEHLKEDPFKIFITNAIETIKESKKIFITGIIILTVLIASILIFLHFKTLAQEKANKQFVKIIRVMESSKDIDNKITQLEKFKDDDGINGILRLNLASLYFMKKEYDKAEKELDMLSTSINLINEKKTIIKAEILVSKNKKEEALELLSKFIKKDYMEIPKDTVLLRIAKLQNELNKKKEAINTLKSLIKKFPRTYTVNNYAGLYGMEGEGEAKILLKELEASK